LIEKADLSSGSTWHAAGQCPSFIADYNMAKVHHSSNTLYPKLEELTGQQVDWHGCGGIRFAITQEELDYFRLVEGVSKNIGFRMQVISPEEIRKLHPFVDTTGVITGAWTLDDGHVDPSSANNAMAIGANNMDATIERRNRVLETNALPSGEWEVVTEKGTILCEHVVNAAGCYTDRIGAWVGINLPFINILHQYIVTETIEELAERDVELPVIRDPYCSAYYRQEQDGGLIGIYERENTRVAWADQKGQDWDAENEFFPEDFDQISYWAERVMERMPIYRKTGVVRIVNDAISHTPDSNPLVGPAPGVRNYWLSTGASIGIAQGGGCGKYLAQWMVHGAAEINMIGLDPRRFGDFAGNDYVSAESHREYQDMYDLLLPGQERMDGRPSRDTPLYEIIKAKGCVYTEVMGWERPKWFSLDGREEQGGFRRNVTFEVVADDAVCAALKVSA